MLLSIFSSLALFIARKYEGSVFIGNGMLMVSTMVTEISTTSSASGGHVRGGSVASGSSLLHVHIIRTYKVHVKAPRGDEMICTNKIMTDI